jgi:hypothetical protein
MPRKILFPISVGNRSFSTKNIKVALEKMPSDISDITFLIADWLQLYNRVRDSSGAEKLGSIIRDYQTRNEGFINRQNWLANFLGEYPEILSAKHRIVGMESCFDALYAHTFRNVSLLYLTDSHFASDVHSSAASHFRANKKLSSSIAVKLSEQYILEEIALNIRLRVHDNIQEEYYMGGFHEPLVKLYESCYSASAWELYGGAKDKECNFMFFNFIPDLSSQWEVVKLSR